MIKIGPLRQKLLLLLEGGLFLGLSGDPRQQFRILSGLGMEWKKINRQSLQRAIRGLYESQLVEVKENEDGSVKLFLNKEGTKRALCFKLSEMKIQKPKYWDKKWRVVVFDIPESFKKEREVLRAYLKQLGFYQLQRSVFVLPYECGDEIEFLIELYGIREYVRQFVATGVDNELHLKDIFQLSV